ncbi:MAG: DUF4386 family protein [Bacteroidales bacterium]|nr:DUF4386 family protein [Bacteroidales bacterium]
MEQEKLFGQNWEKLFKPGAIAAIVIVALIPIQIFIFAAYPPPDNPAGFFELFSKNWFLGLLSLDLLYIINNTVIIVLYLALFAALKNTSFIGMLTALAFGLIGITSYYSSAVAFEMLSVGKQYNQAVTVEMKQQLMAVGYAMLATYKGTSFDVYYVLNAITLLIISVIMFRSSVFTRPTAVWGIISGIFMIIPSTAGKIGLVFSLISLIPWIVFSIMVAKKLFWLHRASIKAF